MRYCNSFKLSISILIILTLSYYTVPSTALTDNKKDLLKQAKLPPCRSCKVFVESFKKGMKKTENGKYEGGDAAWEEEKLGAYSRSEVRLVEVQEHVCADVNEGQAQCYTFNENVDTIIEDWWFKGQDSNPDLFEYLCISTMKQCCPENKYGEDCLECPGYPDNVCGNNGKCKGAGTRKGNGQCACDSGYTGNICTECAPGYFESYKDNKKTLCSPCHISCDGGCTKPGPKGCFKCLPGWVDDSEKGCTDINECVEPRPPCGPAQFCVNNEGGYKCLECDKSCTGCTGDGPDMCLNCAYGFELKDGRCTDSEQEGRHRYVLFTRYATYFGLCIATCIIFQRSYVLAAVIGLIVAIYISTSEYILNSVPAPNNSDLAEQLVRMSPKVN